MSGEAKRGLGRGLSALLGDVAREQPAVAAGADGDGVRTIPLASIRAHPDQPRRFFDEDALDELAASIKARGVLQPIVVRRVPDGFQLVAGERRWRAAQRAQLDDIPAIVRTLSDSETLEVAIIENIQRADLNAIEEAEAYRRLMQDFGHSQDEVGRFVNKSRSHVANLLRLLELPTMVRQRVAEGALTMGHARALITADDPAALAEQVLRQDLSVRDTERLARVAKTGTSRVARQRGNGGRGSQEADADIVALERQLGDILGLAVEIAHEGEGGAVTLRYSSLDQLDMVCQRLTGERF